MPKYNVKVTQVQRVEQHTIIEIEASDSQDLAQMIDEGDYDLPAAQDPLWVIDSTSVENEQTEVL